MTCMALSFGFKLQAVFILPVCAVLWMQGKFKWYHFLVFPAVYVLLVLPAVIIGRPFMDTLLLYFGQTGSIGTGLNYNSPSVFALIRDVADTDAAAKAGIALLRSENAGRATFLPLDTVQPGFFRGSLSGSARLASSLVKADPRYVNIVSNLLGRIVVVDDINEASRVARELGYHNKVLSLIHI